MKCTGSSFFLDGEIRYFFVVKPSSHHPRGRAKFSVFRNFRSEKFFSLTNRTLLELFTLSATMVSPSTKESMSPSDYSYGSDGTPSKEEEEKTIPFLRSVHPSFSLPTHDESGTRASAMASLSSVPFSFHSHPVLSVYQNEVFRVKFKKIRKLQGFFPPLWFLVDKRSE